MDKSLLINRMIKFLPNIFWPIKLIILRKQFTYLGKNVKISSTSTFTDFSNIEIEDDVFIGPNFYCSIQNGLTIKKRVMFGANCSIIGGDHNYSDPYENMRFTQKKGSNNHIIIEDDAWIGHGSLILKNSFISEGCIIGANSLVNNKLKPYCVYAGQPVRLIKPRFSSKEKLQSYLKMMTNKHDFKSNYDVDQLLSLIYDDKNNSTKTS